MQLQTTNSDNSVQQLTELESKTKMLNKKVVDLAHQQDRLQKNGGLNKVT